MNKFIVCMINAKHSDGRVGDAFLGRDLEFSTLDANEAEQFDAHDAERFANHWRYWYRGFSGGCVIEVRGAGAKAEA